MPLYPIELALNTTCLFWMHVVPWRDNDIVRVKTVAESQNLCFKFVSYIREYFEALRIIIDHVGFWHF